MRTVDLGRAQAELERLVEDALSGEEIVITRDGEPVARLVPIASATEARRLGTAAGHARIGEDFDAPLEEFEDGAGEALEEGSEGELFLGIDFSGDVTMWNPRCRRSNVWLAFVRRRRTNLSLENLLRVQQLAGQDHPFQRMRRLLATAAYRAAAVDAPFSLPMAVMSGRVWTDLLEEVAQLPLEGRPFTRAADFIDHFVGPPRRKIYRQTEHVWIAQHVNVRSTTWRTHRGGAEMTCAALTLLRCLSGRVWPWSNPPNGSIIEAFPAAQLRQWQLPHQRYAKPEERPRRECIVRELERQQGLHFGAHRAQALESADALDAVLAAFAAIAVVDDVLAIPPGPEFEREGWIAVYQ